MTPRVVCAISPPKAPKPERMTAAEVEIALRSHFDSPRYAVVTGVRNDGGWDAGRTCDLLAMGTWDSVGRHLHGVEIKVARSDWLREIQDITKAEAFAAYCDFWWIAAPPAVVRLEELPATWGLLEVVGKGMKVRRPATRLDAKPVTRGMLASLCRRVQEQSPAEEVLKAAVVKARQEERAEARSERAQRDHDFDIREAQQAVKVLAAFREATGCGLYEWNVKDEGPRFKRFRETENAEQMALLSLKRVREELKEALERLDAAVERAEGSR